MTGVELANFPRVNDVKGLFNRMIIEDHDILETYIGDDDEDDDTEHASEYV